MPGKRLVFTEIFSRNLTAIQEFLGAEGEAAFQRLLGRLFDDILPTVARYPKAGRVFLAHPIRSAEAKNLVKKLKARLGAKDDFRECIVDDYLLLYLIRRDRVVCLSIKHHRQLSFDLKRFWMESARRIDR
ncbi:MAG: type II toxin-antitoxin system RelE/ParE family toxin [Nitrospirales bacterium]